MTRSKLGHYALICVAIAALAGCGVTQPTIGAPGMTPQRHASLVRVSGLPATTKGALIYAPGFNEIYILNFPSGSLVTTIRDNLVHGNACADDAGNVFVPAYNSQTQTGEIDEYAHGSTTPNVVVTLQGREPGDCSVDAITGNLAFTDSDTSGKNGMVAIYKSATQMLQRYHIGDGYALASCGYDNNGNLFAARGAKPQLYELVTGGNRFNALRLNEWLGWPGTIQWYAGFLAVEEEAPHGAIDRLSISGSGATVVGRSPLRINGHGHDRLASWLYQATVIAPIGWRGAELGFWAYPKAGDPTKILKNHKRWMRSVAVSGGTL